MRLVELRISHTQQVNYGEEECKAAVMYATHLHPKTWEFAVSKKLFGGGQDGMQHSDNLTERSIEMAKVGQISKDGSQCGSVYSDNGNSPTLTAGTHGDANSKVCTEYRIRKLTPKECWRLMDFSDEDFHKAEKVNSNTQLYKQAGNSIVVNVLVAILGQLFSGKEDVYKNCEVKTER